jgi:hypothetical protein
MDKTKQVFVLALALIFSLSCQFFSLPGEPAAENTPTTGTVTQTAPSPLPSPSIPPLLPVPVPVTQTAPLSASAPVIHPGWTSITNTNDVTQLAFDRDGNLWSATHGGVVRWNLKDDSYLKYTTENGLADNDVWSAASAADGSLWFGTWSGAAHFDGQTWTSSAINHSLTDQ